MNAPPASLTPTTRTRTHLGRLFIAALVALMACPVTGEASQKSAAAKQTASAISRSAKARLLQIAKLDRAAHRQAASKVLKAPRKVFRYTTSAEATREVQGGFGRFTHFTTRAGRGRPLSSAHAQQRYGLTQTPRRTTRMMVTLPSGTPIKSVKVHGGSRGIGEIVNTRRIPPGKTDVRVLAIK